jgi:apolipoprotein D and lipocalin family protein
MTEHCYAVLMQQALRLFFISILSLLGSSGCSTSNQPPIAPVESVDLSRFMGDWYVIAAIPTYIERESFNAVESYTLRDDGRVATTFKFNKGSLTGPWVEYHPTGFVRENTGNAVWGMQFIWPIKAEFIIAHLDSDYRTTIIARNARDYVWIMAREPQLSESDYSLLVKRVTDWGYDIGALRKVPHRQP